MLERNENPISQVKKTNPFLEKKKRKENKKYPFCTLPHDDACFHTNKKNDACFHGNGELTSMELWIIRFSILIRSEAFPFGNFVAV